MRLGERWRAWRDRTTGGAPLFPLVVLFGLNAADELDRAAFSVLLPDIRDHFGLDTQGILTVVGLSVIAALVLALPIGYWADHGKRSRLAVAGAVVWGCFSVLTGLAWTVVVLGIARAGSGLGRAVNEPVHNSLLADHYDISVRPRVYAVHRAANPVGQFVGPVVGGLVAYAFGWRVPFLLFAVPTVVFAVLALRMKEPVRGAHERRAMGASEEAVATEEVPPSWAESWRILWQVRTLRRVFYALPFVAIAIVGLLTLGSLFYEEVFDLDERARGFVAASTEPAQLLGFVVGIPIATKLLARDPGLVLKFLAFVSVVVAAMWVVFSQAPNLPIAIGANVVISGALGLLVPGIYTTLSLAVPPKVRAFGFAVATIWIIPGLVMLPIVGGLADSWGIRPALLLMAPVFVLGGLILASGGAELKGDIERVWTTSSVLSEVAYARQQGRVKLLAVRGLDVAYDGVQVLFGVDLEVDEGEVVALLGTNGAGKSTLLRAISGLVEPSNGAVVFDGRDMTHTPPDEVAARGVVQVPGGQGVLTGLTVAENLRLAGWTQRHDKAAVAASVERVLDVFPALRSRLDEPAGNLSGGQQQMLTLAMAFVSKPRLLMIDELSLGLAPAVVAQLLDIIREFKAQGTTIILVEQSVNVALSVAETAYFMEKGEIRFHGPSAELLDRPDVLRSVFLEGAASRNGGSGSGNGGSESGDGVPAAATAQPAEDVDASTLRLEARGVTKRFGGIAALRDVSFTVAAGEIVGVIGPNGAGKTTLFDVVSGFQRSDGGRILLRDAEAEVHDVTEYPAAERARLGLGRSFQDGRLFPALTVAETIAVAFERQVDVRDPLAAALHLPMATASERDLYRRVDELVELMGLGAFRDKFVRELSTGSRRIVDLACVLAHRPHVLLLDEPSSGIAQREAEALGPLLLRIRDELGTSLVVIEHDLPLLSSIADRMVALDLGAVIADGLPSAVVHDPDVVRSYLGTDEVAIARSGTVPRI